MDRVEYESIIIQDLLGYYSRDELNITPWYQRRAVWTRPQKSYLINTIHEGKPVPSIYIRHTIDLETEKSVKEVVDGQQRVRCLLEYKKNLFPARHPNHTKSVAFSDLTNVERRRFLLTSLSAGYLVGATDQDVIEIFARINSVAKTLNPQEKRNAKYSGEFKHFCMQEAVKRLPFWRANGIFTDNDIARMVEVQFASDIVMNLIEGLQDFSAPRLNKYYAVNEDTFPARSAVQKRLDRVFSQLLSLPQATLQGTIFARPQILFSLMLVLDEKTKEKKKVARNALRNCILDLDAAVQAVRSGDNPKALRPDVYESFTTGNMHRIKFRKKRASVIAKRL